MRQIRRTHGNRVLPRSTKEICLSEILRPVHAINLGVLYDLLLRLIRIQVLAAIILIAFPGYCPHRCMSFLHRFKIIVGHRCLFRP